METAGIRKATHTATASLSLYVRVALPFAWNTTEQVSRFGSHNSHDTHGVGLDLSMLMLLHLSEHFFVGLGPGLYHDLTRADQRGFENQETSIGLRSTVGGNIEL